MNFDAPKTAKNGKFRYFYIKKSICSKRYLWFCIFASSNCKFYPFSVKKKWKSSKCSKKKSWHLRKKRCMELLLGISCRIHKKYQFWNLRPRVKSIIHFGMEWPNIQNLQYRYWTVLNSIHRKYDTPKNIFAFSSISSKDAMLQLRVKKSRLESKNSGFFSLQAFKNWNLLFFGFATN